MRRTSKEEYSIGKIRFHKFDHQKKVFEIRKSVSNKTSENIKVFVKKRVK